MDLDKTRDARGSLPPFGATVAVAPGDGTWTPAGRERGRTSPAFIAEPHSGYNELPGSAARTFGHATSPNQRPANADEIIEINSSAGVIPPPSRRDGLVSFRTKSTKETPNQQAAEDAFNFLC